MSGIIVCGQFDVLGDTCPGCGGYVHRVRRGGFPGPMGRHCDEDCAADADEWLARQRAAEHVRMRDLMCECDTCTAAGHPTVGERAEWAEYLAAYGGLR